MAVVDDGKNRIRDLISDDIHKGQWGTGTTPVTAADTAVEDGVTATLLAVTQSKTDRQIIMDHNLGKLVANGESLGNFVITMNSGTDLLLREAVTSFTKQNTEQWQTSVVLFIE